ncbi:uncharacterized protein LOC113652556 [Tachysurus ichikawai]
MRFLHTWLLFTQVRATDPPCSLLGLHNPPQLTKDGDVMIGGIFSVHIKWDQINHVFTSGPQQPDCISLSLREFQSAQTMVFAIEEINNRTDILPGVKLGYRIYDSCGSIEMTTRASLSLVNGNGKNISVNSCSKPDTVQAIIGQTSSSPSIAISALVGPLHIPVVSHFATCACLSDKKKYPSFFRTVSSDYYQSRALAKLEMALQNMTGFQWIGSESWISDMNTANAEWQHILKGSMGFAIPKAEINGLREFLTNLNPDNKPWQVLSELKKLHFTSTTGEDVYFDENGDPAARYELLNWQQGKDSKTVFVKVGFYDASLNTDLQLSFNNISIVWAHNKPQVPVSVCSPSCPPGTRKAVQKGRPICCFDCIPCAEGEISNITDSISCIKCPHELWSNGMKDTCVLNHIHW